MKKFLYVIMVAMVNTSIHCMEIVSMMPSVEELVPVKSLKEIEKFTGNFVAYKGNAFLRESVYVIENPGECHYGYLGKSLDSLMGASEGYILSRLLSNDQWLIGPECVPTSIISNCFMKRNDVSMRKVTIEEMIAITRSLRINGAMMSYGDTSDESDAEKLVDYVYSSILDIADAVYYNRYSKGLFKWPEFCEFLCCINKQYPDFPKDLLLSNKCILGYLGLLKLRSCVYY
jgi:hypothetical protein